MTAPPTADATRRATGARPAYLRAFLRAPLGWLLLAALVFAVAAEARVREGNRLACAAVSMLLDRQNFREVIAGPGRGEIEIVRACLSYAVPDTYDVRNLPEVDAARVTDGMP